MKTRTSEVVGVLVVILVLLSGTAVRSQEVEPGAPIQYQGQTIGSIEDLRAHSRFPGHALTPTGVMAIRCKQFHLPDL